ncbi:MAG TPA: septum formation initiator family protein [Kiritimatiellia bacterium]|nr:septum formation initiator family protein [Kiritimatiellia bacterium]HMO98021.1 septum formation initiator family protein [Kiritimatiellia bacterium]HMP97472.1 septum formation initiator family protein [Kiritimatiellia bacterium]
MSVWVLIYRVSAALIIAVFLIWAGSLFWPRFQQAHDLSARQLELEEEIRRDEEVLRHLRLKQQRLLNDPRFVEKIAREELGLAKPGETVFKFVDETAPSNTRTGAAGRIRP